MSASIGAGRLAFMSGSLLPGSDHVLRANRRIDQSARFLYERCAAPQQGRSSRVDRTFPFPGLSDQLSSLLHVPMTARYAGQVSHCNRIDPTARLARPAARDSLMKDAK
jgi:hypothetical protein